MWMKTSRYVESSTMHGVIRLHVDVGHSGHPLQSTVLWACSRVILYQPQTTSNVASISVVTHALIEFDPVRQTSLGQS